MLRFLGAMALVAVVAGQSSDALAYACNNRHCLRADIHFNATEEPALARMARHGVSRVPLWTSWPWWRWRP